MVKCKILSNVENTEHLARLDPDNSRKVYTVNAEITIADLST